MCERLIYDGHVAVALELRQVTVNQITQLVDGGVGFFDLFPEAAEDLFGFVLEKLNQDIVFVFKIEVNRSVGDAGLPGDLGYGRLMKPSFGKYFNGCFKDALVFIPCFRFCIDKIPP